MCFILCKFKSINDLTKGTIDISLMVHEFHFGRGYRDSGEAIATIAYSRPIGERTIIKGSGTFRLTRVANHKLEKTGCIVIIGGGTVSMCHWICSFIVVDMSTFI